MHPKTRPVDWWKRERKFLPQMYRTAPAMTAEAFADFIYDFENGSKRRKAAADKINRNEAREIFTFLRRVSFSAEQRKIEKDIIIVYDDRTCTWRGFDTNPPDATMGIKRETRRHAQLKDSHRAKLGDINPCSRDEMLGHICDRYKCDLAGAEQFFATASKSIKCIMYHRATNTWRGCFSENMPIPADTVEVGPTLRQEEYRERYGEMPPLFHDYMNLEQSPRLKWIAELDGCSIADAEKTHHNVWNVSKDRSKLAWRNLPKGIAAGVDYVEPVILTEEMRAAIRSLGWSFRTVDARHALTVLGVKDERTLDYLAEARRLGDWESRIGITRKDGTKEEKEVFAGSDWWRGYDERQATQPAVKQQQDTVKPEHQKQPEATPESKSHAKTDAQFHADFHAKTNELSGRMRNMPRLLHAQAIEWAHRITGGHNQSHPPELIFNAARRLNHIRQVGACYEGASQT